MAKNCEIPSEFRQEHGFSENFFKSIRTEVDPIKLTKDEVRKIVKNIGIDDARAIELRDGKGHLFGRNLKKIEEFDPSKGKVPSNTLVKRINNDGEVEYFLSERATNMAPSKWIVNENKSVLKNPDWSFVGKNATTDATGAVKKFSATEKSKVFKPDPDGDVILKVSKIYEGANPPPKYKLAEQGYDAIRTADGSLDLFDTSTQAVNRSRITIRDDVTGVDKSTKQVDMEAGETAQRLEGLGMAPRMAMTLGGALAGETFAEDYGGMWIGGALGFALGMPKIKNSMKNVLKGSEDVDISSRVKSLAEAEEKAKEGVELMRDGYRGALDDEQAKQSFKDKFWNEMKALRSRGQSAWNTIFKSDFFRSGITTLQDMGSPTTRWLGNVLQRTESAHNPYMRIANDVLNETYGSKISLDEFKQKQIDLVKRFVKERTSISDVVTKDDEFLLKEMGTSIRRIITHEVELDDAGELLIKDDRYVTENVYGKDVVRDQDAFFLNSAEGRKIIEAHRQIFDRMGEKAHKSFQDALNKLRANELKGEASRAFENFYNSGLSIKQWRRQASDHMVGIYNRVRQNPAFKEAVQFREQQQKIEALKGRYIPQVQSHEKITQLKREFLEDEGLLKATSQEQDEAWFERFKKRIIAYNHDGFTAKGLSASGDDVETLYFRTFENAVNDLRNHHAYDILDDGVKSRVLAEIQSNDPTVLAKYIGQKNIDGKTSYFIKNPDHIDYNITKDMSAESMGEAQKMFLNMVTLRQSDFLDNPRQFILPNDMLENNMQKIINRYSRDVGVRTHLIDAGLGTERKLKQTFTKIQRELEEKGVERDLSKELDSIKSWYATITNTKHAVEVDMSPSEVIARARRDRQNNKIARTVMNLAAMPFMWFTSFYAPFTPAILGSYLASPRNIMKSYGEVLRDPQALKSMTDNLYKYGAIEKKLRSMSEEAQFGDYGKDMLEGTDSSFLNWMYDISNKGINFSTRFSVGKRIMKGMGMDVENSGMLRLTTGDLYDITGAESALTSMAVLREIEDMSEAGMKIIKGRQAGKEVLEATGGGKTYRLGDVERRLKELGIENPRRFMEEAVKETNGVRNSKSFYNVLTGRADEAPISDYLQNEYSRLMDTVINQYHGRTKLSRPLKWVDNVYGRVLSQFSVYAQNFGVQTVRRRMYQPLKDWSDNYNMKKDTPLYQVYWHMQRNNTSKLKEIFGEDKWQQAFDDFPIQAVDNIFKITPLVMGVGATMTMTRDSVMDMINMVANEAMGNDNYEEWEKTNENMGYVRELLDEGPTGYNMAKVTLGALNNAVHMGYFSRYAQIFRQAEYGSIADATPATGMLSEGYNVLGEPFNHSLADAPKQTSKALLEYIMLRSPVLGTFNGPREGAVDALFNQPKNKKLNIEDLNL